MATSLSHLRSGAYGGRFVGASGQRHTRTFEDVVGFLAQMLNQTAVAELTGIAWVTVGSIADCSRMVSKSSACSHVLRIFAR